MYIFFYNFYLEKQNNKKFIYIFMFTKTILVV